jgi:DNA-binding NarL/FixJ family response regulator
VAGGPILGRARELGFIEQGVVAARASAGGLILVCGEPGIGKTRLLVEATANAATSGALVAWGRCREDGEAPPFLPWVQLLRSAVEQRGAVVSDLRIRWPEVVGLLDPPADPATEHVPPSAQFRLFTSFIEIIAHLGRQRGLVAVIDDLHRADQASLALLDHAALELATLPVLLVAAYRDTEAPSGGMFAGQIARVTEAAGAPVVSLGGLAQHDVSVLISRLAGPVGSAVAAIVAERTNGNPFFVTEIALALRAGPNQDAIAAETLPPTVLALITARVDRLPSETRHALEAAAVLGRDFGRMPLAGMLGTTEIAIAAAMQPAASTGLIASGPGGTYRFTHAMVQSAVYGMLSIQRRSDLHHRAADAIELGRSDDDERVSDLAFHSYHAAIDGDLGPALGHTLMAGRRAARRLAFDESVMWLSRALELAERASLSAPEMLEVILDLAEAEHDAGLTKSARRHFERGAEIARSADLPSTLGRCALGVGTTVVSAGRVDWDLVRLLEEAASRASSGSERAVLGSRLAIELYWHDGGAPARVASRAALVSAEASGDQRAVGVALQSLQFTLRSPDHLLERVAIGERLVASTSDTGQHDLEFDGRLWLAADVLRAADVVRFRELVRSLEAISARTRLPLQRWYSLVMVGQLAAIEGRFDEALRLADESSSLGERLGAEIAPAYRLGQRCVLARERGGLGLMADDIKAQAERMPHFVTIRSFAALTAATTGDLRAARLEVDRLAGDGFSSVPRDSLWVATVALLTEAAAISGSTLTSELVSLLAPHRGTLVVNGLPNCWGSCDRFLGRAYLALADLETAADHLASAERLEASSGLLVHLARTRLDLARLAGARGDARTSASLVKKVLGVASDLRLDALESEAQAVLAGETSKSLLSRREQEVLHHLSRGSSNKEIAATLSISLNTVERHLANIYSKLGVRGRADAVAWAIRAEIAQG